MNYYSFIVDTDSYAGNFEREMTAYATGTVGECEVGLAESVLFDKDYPDLDLYDQMYQRPDEDGTLRPCAIEQSVITNQYDSVAMYFLSNPCEYLDMLKKRSLEYAKKNNIIIRWFRVNFIEEIRNTHELYIKSA